jgi:cation:H+ antiporter
MTINLILLTILSLFVLLISANYLIENIVSLAKKINVSKFAIASCTIAFGTTMPELTTSLKSVLTDPPHSGIAVGNLLGSNIANILLIMGVSAMILPVDYQRQFLSEEGLLILILNWWLVQA